MERNRERDQSSTLKFDLGTFEGFNFRDASAISGLITAQEVVDWDHDQEGEAEFWPSGDSENVSLLFAGRSSVSGTELVELDNLLQEIGDDSEETILKIAHLVRSCGYALGDVTPESVQDLNAFIFLGHSFFSLRNTAAYELFELFYPGAYRAWEESTCDGLIFDVERFLDSPSLTVEELTLGSKKVLFVVAE